MVAKLAIQAVLGLLLLVWASVATAQELRIGRAVDSPLYDVAERIMAEAAQRAGMTMQFQRMPIARSIGLVSDGELDGDMLRIEGIEDRYPNLIRLSVSTVHADIAAYGHTPGFENLSREELKQMKFGIPKGILLLRKHTEGLQVSETQTYATLYDMLSAGRFDVVVMSQIDAEAVLRERPVKNVVRWPRYWASEPLYFVLNRKHAALVPRLERALIDMRKEGLLKKYYAEGLKKYDVKRLAPL